jgi:hypothetical protein
LSWEQGNVSETVVFFILGKPGAEHLNGKNHFTGRVPLVTYPEKGTAKSSGKPGDTGTTR